MLFFYKNLGIFPAFVRMELRASAEQIKSEYRSRVMCWYIYIVECSDKTLYTGIAKDVHRRLEEHNSSKLGAKYTRARRPVELVFSEKSGTRSEACKREAEIKKLTRIQKKSLINQPGK